MANGEAYQISFGALAGTLVYEDPSGVIVFAFEIFPSEDTEKGKWMLGLSSKPRSEDGKLINVDPSGYRRVSQAFERTKQYVLSRGYQVKVSGVG